MWHAFDIISEGLTVAPELLDVHAGAGTRLVYGERVVRWFSDKSGKGQWPAVVDHKPGIVIERHSTTAVDGADWKLRVEHIRAQTVPVTMRMNMTCAPDMWRSPREWDLKESLGDQDKPSALQATSETGRWQAGRVTRTIRAGTKRIDNVYNATHPACLYPMLADFPVKEIDAGEFQDQPCDALFTEGMQQFGGGSMVDGAPGDTAHHKRAAGLRCFRLVPAGGFPLEFWVNTHGVVIYLIEGATRAWVLQSVEAMP
jgi:hypothetical protein